MKKKQNEKEAKGNRSKIRTNNRENKTRNATLYTPMQSLEINFDKKLRVQKKTRFLHRIQCPILGC